MSGLHDMAAAQRCHRHPKFDIVQLRQVANGWEVKLPPLEFNDGFGFDFDENPEPNVEKKDRKIPKDESLFVFKTFDEVVEFLKTKIQQ